MGVIPETPRFYEFPLNRYDALVEAQRLFEINHVDLKKVFEVLFNSIDGFLAFRFGDVGIVFLRDSELSDNSDSIHVSIVLENEEMRRSISFEFQTSNIGLLRERIQDDRFEN